jgi:cellulase/cellobiase CelA1
VLSNTVDVYQDWTSGYCANVTVKNSKTSTVTWATDVAVDGTIYTLWNAAGNAVSGTVRFTGVSGATTLPAGASVQFGYCANRSSGIPAPTSAALTAKITVFDDWTSGYCATAAVTNDKSSPVTWTAEVPVEGTIFDLWSAVGSGTSGKVRFSGVDYNETLQPGASTDFGWCANRSVGAPADNSLLPNTVKITNDWGGGYCATVTVQNSGSAPVAWATDVEVDGTMYAHYGATPSADSGTIRFTGADYNQTLAPGKSAKFGFCANRGSSGGSGG